MKSYVLLGFFLFLAAMNPRESTVYFNPTGKYFPTENWPKVLENTSEHQRQRNIGMQNVTKPRNQRGAQDSGKNTSLLRGVNENAATKEFKPINNGEERILIATVETKEEASKLIEKLKKANRKGAAGSYIKKLKKRFSNEGGSRNLIPKKGFRVWGTKKYKDKKAVWAF